MMHVEDRRIAVAVAKRTLGLETSPQYEAPVLNWIRENLRADQRTLAPGHADQQIISAMDRLVHKHGFSMSDALVTVRPYDFDRDIYAAAAWRRLAGRKTTGGCEAPRIDGIHQDWTSCDYRRRDEK